jgi:hypothetical protein
MVFTQARRLGTTLLVVLSLLFSQLALANYVCSPAVAGEPIAMEMAPGEPCEEMAAHSQSDQPALCYQHCADAPQTFDAVKLPTLSLPAVVQVLVVPLALDGATEAAAFADAGEAQPPPEPIYLSTLRLRV